MRGVLRNKIQKKELKTGDHIYTLRGSDTKAHHGIYVNDKNVIHFTRGACSDHTCPTCGDFYGVVASCIDCFLSGGDIHRFKYGVNPANFLAKLGGGCTLASTDKAEDVQHRACFLLNNGSGAYYRYINNGEDFAIFCKTGFLVVDMVNFSRRWQIAYFLAVTAAVFLSLQQQLMLFSFTGFAARFLGLYCICRFAPDIGARPNVIKINNVHRLPKVDKILAYGGSNFRLIESFIDMFVLVLMLFLSFCLLASTWPVPHLWSMTLLVVWTQACIIFFYWAVLQKVSVFLRLLSNKIQKEQLRRGDHIYTWRNGYTYSHHGIYVGDGDSREVIHLVRGEDPIIPSSLSSSHSHPSDSYIQSMPLDCRVEYCSIDSFVDGGELNLYKYGVNYAFFMAKTRGGTCTHIPSDPPNDVVYRARYLEKHSSRFGAYNLFNNNCEDLAIYCKTALLSPKDFIDIGRNGQTASLLAVVYAIAIFIAFLLSPKKIIAISRNGHIIASLMGILAVFYSNFIGAATTVYILYCMVRFITDIAFVTTSFRLPVQQMISSSRLADWFQSNFCHFILS